MTLAIPKRKVAATVQVQHGPTLKGHLFLDTATATHTGPQTVTEYLALQDAFIPFEAADGFLFMAKDSVAMVTISEEDEAVEKEWDVLPLVPEDEAPREVRVRVELRGGTIVEGEMVSALPPEHRRLIDYLNQPVRFLSLRRGDELCLVNKQYVASARPLTAG